MDLIKGYTQFLNQYFEQQPEVYQKLVKEQVPEILFLACCDSRIDPAILTCAKPGELFVVRNIANYVPQYVNRSLESEAMTAIELGIAMMPIKQVIVLGHQHCAGIRAIACSGCSDQNMPVVWYEQCARLQEVVQEQYAADTAHKFEKENIKLACHDLLTYPFIKQRVDQGQLTVIGWYFSLETGAIEVYDPEHKQFDQLVPLDRDRSK